MSQKQNKHEKNTHNQMLLAEKKMEEIGGNMKGWDILGPLPGKSHVECHSVGISTREEIILGVCEMSGTPRIKK